MLLSLFHLFSVICLIVCMQCLLPQITRICNVFEGVADLGDHLVFRYILPKHFCVDLVNKLLQLLQLPLQLD